MSVTPTPYIPSFLRAAVAGNRPLSLVWSAVSDTNIASTASFQYDAAAGGIKSTQQLNVDWSQFQNHTFFMAAEAKVNLAFDQIINGFPFDGTRQETEVFFDNLSGFDKWVFDQFPVYHGELTFSGTQTSETAPTAGTYIVVQNRAGALFPELSTNDTGLPVLNPTGSTSLTLEMQLYLPPIANGTQVVCQMLSCTAAGPATQGYSLCLLTTASTSSVTAQFSVVSGSSYMSVPVQLTKGQFNHIAVELNRDDGMPFLEAFLQGIPVAKSPTMVEMGNLAIDSSNFIIGSGTAFILGTTTTTPTQTLSGTLDEFRMFFSARTPTQQQAYAQKALYATTDLVLYYKFNEPPPPITLSASDVINGIVLDSSGNSLHALISNFTGTLRLNAAADPLSPITFERPESCPVLFPAYAPIVALNQALLASASAYDQENPNLITKLIPQHYLLEGAMQDGFQEPEGTANQAYAGNGLPGQGKMGNVQILVSLLYIYARFFDDIKLFVDSFTTLRTVDYDTGDVIAADTVPDNFLNNLISNTGFFMPPMFADSDIDQYVRGENVDIDQYATNDNTLRYVQHTLTRRVLKNLPSVIRSKGTQYSIQAFLRAVGIDPNNIMRLREVGGPTTQALSFARESKIEPGAMVQFTTASTVISPYLSASRVEPGFPPPAGTFVIDGKGHNVGTTVPSDGLLTSGSWTWEGIVKFTPASIAVQTSSTQSLARLCVTGTLACNNNGGAGIIANLLAISSSVQPKLVLYVCAGALTGSGSPVLRLELDTPVPNVYTGPPPLGIFNGDRWNVSFGCQRGDDGLNSSVSSSYFLRLGYQNNGTVQYLTTTSSFFQEAPRGEVNAFTQLNAASNAHGPFLAVGTTQIIPAGTGVGYSFLNNNLAAPSEARSAAFNGRLSNVRFWSRALNETEWEEHIRNYSSTGVEDPLTNWNYVTSQSGSWGKMRLNAMVKQDVRTANATASLGPTGAITLIDFSENNLHLVGTNFPTTAETVVGEVFDLSFFSPYFDEATTNEKVRSRSYQDFALVQKTPWASLAPVYEINPSEQPTDDVRFIMEFSLLDALNRDIIAIFGTLDSLDNAMGSPDLLFSPDYPDIENLRNVYFNRIKQKLNFAAFFDFFRWFDSSIGTFIEQLIPRKTNFKGVNFTIESHMLERHKQEYLSSQIYLGDSIRTNLDSVILLQQVVGQIVKY